MTGVDASSGTIGRTGTKDSDDVDCDSVDR